MWYKVLYSNPHMFHFSILPTQDYHHISDKRRHPQKSLKSFQFYSTLTKLLYSSLTTCLSHVSQKLHQILKQGIFCHIDPNHQRVSKVASFFCGRWLIEDAIGCTLAPLLLEALSFLFPTLIVRKRRSFFMTSISKNSQLEYIFQVKRGQAHILTFLRLHFPWFVACVDMSPRLCGNDSPECKIKYADIETQIVNIQIYSFIHWFVHMFVTTSLPTDSENTLQ